MIQFTAVSRLELPGNEEKSKTWVMNDSMTCISGAGFVVKWFIRTRVMQSPCRSDRCESHLFQLLKQATINLHCSYFCVPKNPIKNYLDKREDPRNKNRIIISFICYPFLLPSFENLRDFLIGERSRCKNGIVVFLYE